MTTCEDMAGPVRFCRRCQAWHSTDFPCVTFEDAALYDGPPQEETPIDHTEAGGGGWNRNGVPLELYTHDPSPLEEYREDQDLGEEP